jgi:hypothetical protein
MLKSSDDLVMYVNEPSTEGVLPLEGSVVR